MPHVLRCFLCEAPHDPNSLQTTCSKCGKPLRVDLDLAGLRPESIDGSRADLWRYARFLPCAPAVSLGEGWTPLRHTSTLGDGVWLKDEGVNPTASFKARGMAVAVAMAKSLGATELAVPSAGNAGGAMSAYAAAHGMVAHVFMPADTPSACVIECKALGANVILIDGLITDCAAEIQRQIGEGAPWFDMSTLKEPYRVEGKKTMGYELFEQLGRLPDAIIYPTGGGTGLVGMWKAFGEMEQLGWISSDRPKMISVQTEGCCPLVNAFMLGERFAIEHQNAQTVASGLRVPRAIGDFIILDLIRASGGTAIAIPDDEMIRTAKEIGRSTGVFACPEGGATLAAYRRLIGSGFLSSGETVVLFNTGSGTKYLEAMG